MVERGPDVEPTGIGFGLALVATVTPAALSSLASADGEVEDGRLRDYGPAPSDGLEVAFALIRDGDEAAKKRDFIKAEDCYRRGLGRLPQDGETQRNVAAPVHVDWARALVEIGRTAEARRALDRALEIVPEFEAARLMLERLPMPNR
jgi:tetratricopeptide (TPR) repeat protein